MQRRHRAATERARPPPSIASAMRIPSSRAPGDAVGGGAARAAPRSPGGRPPLLRRRTSRRARPGRRRDLALESTSARNSLAEVTAQLDARLLGRRRLELRERPRAPPPPPHRLGVRHVPASAAAAAERRPSARAATISQASSIGARPRPHSSLLSDAAAAPPTLADTAALSIATMYTRCRRRRARASARRVAPRARRAINDPKHRELRRRAWTRAAPGPCKALHRRRVVRDEAAASAWASSGGFLGLGPIASRRRRASRLLRALPTTLAAPRSCAPPPAACARTACSTSCAPLSPLTPRLRRRRSAPSRDARAAGDVAGRAARTRGRRLARCVLLHSCSDGCLLECARARLARRRAARRERPPTARSTASPTPA